MSRADTIAATGFATIHLNLKIQKHELLRVETELNNDGTPKDNIIITTCDPEFLHEIRRRISGYGGDLRAEMPKTLLEEHDGKSVRVFQETYYTNKLEEAKSNVLCACDDVFRSEKVRIAKLFDMISILENAGLSIERSLNCDFRLVVDSVQLESGKEMRFKVPGRVEEFQPIDFYYAMDQIIWFVQNDRDRTPSYRMEDIFEKDCLIADLIAAQKRFKSMIKISTGGTK